MIILYRAVTILFDIIETLILIRIIFSWLRIGPYNSLGRIIYEFTEPIMSVARRLIDKIGINTGMFDFSPIVALLIFRLILAFLRAIIF